MQTKVIAIGICAIFILSSTVLFYGEIGLMLFTSQTPPQLSYAWTDPDPQPRAQKAPAVISGDNIYIVWFTDKGTQNSNGEVIFRASNNGGATFGDKINLSNSSETDSIDAEIAAEGDTVVVTWWERANSTNTEPVAKISIDSGATFGPLIKLSTNSTINSNNDGEEG